MLRIGIGSDVDVRFWNTHIRASASAHDGSDESFLIRISDSFGDLSTGNIL